jgi:hypothetical protein
MCGGIDPRPLLPRICLGLAVCLALSFVLGWKLWGLWR